MTDATSSMPAPIAAIHPGPDSRGSIDDSGRPDGGGGRLSWWRGRGWLVAVAGERARAVGATVSGEGGGWFMTPP